MGEALLEFLEFIIEPLSGFIGELLCHCWRFTLALLFSAGLVFLLCRHFPAAPWRTVLIWVLFLSGGGLGVTWEVNS